MDFNVKDFNIRLRTIKIRELTIALILALILSIILVIIFPGMDENGDLFFIALVSLVLIFFAWALRGTYGLGENFSKLFESQTQKEIFYVFIINILFACLFMLLISGLDIILGFGDPNWVSMWDIDTVNVDSSVIIYDAITAIIFAPVVEELVFRGVLFNRLKIRVGIIPSMIITSFLFGIGHSFGGMTSAFLFGLCMCILYLKTDNILVPMSVHFINNIVATAMDITHFDIFAAQFPWIIPSLLLSILGTIYLIGYIYKESKNLKKEYD